MRLTHVALRASFALAFAFAGCSVSATSSTGDTCGGDDTIAGCAAGSFGYSCTGTATPAEGSSSLICSQPTAGNNGATLYCCVSIFAPTTCAPDLTVAGCTSGSQGYSCTGSDTPGQHDSTLNCSAGVAASATSTLYCCASGDGASPTLDAASGDGAVAVSDDGGGDEGTAADGAGDGFATYEAGAGDGFATDGSGGADGAVCGVTGDTGSDSCNQCLDTACCAALEACGTPDDAGTNDAGASACQGLLECTLDCVAGNPDAGVAGDTLSNCQALCNPSYTTSEQAAASALLQCLTTSCASQCQ